MTYFASKYPPKCVSAYLRISDTIGDEVPNLIVDALGFLAARRVRLGEEVLLERRFLLHKRPHLGIGVVDLLVNDIDIAGVKIPLEGIVAGD